MRVEWVGGPEDGKFLECPDSAREIKFIAPASLSPNSYLETVDEAPSAITIDVLTLPIMVRPGGRAFIRYPRNA